MADGTVKTIALQCGDTFEILSKEDGDLVSVTVRTAGDRFVIGTIMSAREAAHLSTTILEATKAP